MTVKAPRFTPQVLLSAPRRSAGIPNSSGTKILYSSSSYDFETHKKTTELRCLHIRDSSSDLISTDDGISDPTWLEDGPNFLVLRSSKGKTEIIVASEDGKKPLKDAEIAGTIDAAAGNLKIARLNQDEYGIVVSAPAGPDGKLYDPNEDKTHSSGRLFKGLYVRHWDEYTGRDHNALWYNVLRRQGVQRKWELVSEWKNALAGGEKGLESPIKPHGGADSFDVSPKGIIFVSKDPAKDPALHTTCTARRVELRTFREDPPKQENYDVPGFSGAKSSPVFSPDGTRAAYLVMRADGYEADKNGMVVALDIDTAGAKVQELSQITASNAKWDHTPTAIKYTADGKSLLILAEDKGHGKLWIQGIDSNESGPTPRALTGDGYVSDVQPLASGAIFFTSSSLTDNGRYSVISTKSQSDVKIWSHSASRFGDSLGLSPSQVSSIWTPASNPKINENIHSWVFRPSFYDSSKKYPLAFLVHGGPQSAWGDSWSTRWNPAIFAEQGYIVVSPNPTGSTGYGQAFVDAIRKNWGGSPYEDLVNVFNYLESEVPDVDTKNAVALGASYGGYMMNWINGHDLGRRFKALVCHDGIFSVSGLLATEELYFPFFDLGGLPFYHPSEAVTHSAARNEAGVRENYGTNALADWKRNDPAEHLHKWTTPTLVIHSSKDYRLCISEGLSAFNVLQARGIESQFLQFPDENHWVLKPENSLFWHKVVINWINKFTGLEQIADEEEEGRGFYGGIVKEEKKEGEQSLPTSGNPGT